MSYETIKASGQVINLGDEVWENKLLDFSTGDGITIMIDGDTIIRNIGARGVYRGGSFIFSITSSGTVEFDNVYLGDGATKEGESFVHGPGGVFLHKNANADVWFYRCNVQGFPNNAFYCSNTATGGSAHFINCYGKNNGVSTFRTGSNNDELENCVAYNDDTNYGKGWGGYTEDSGRPWWHWGSKTLTAYDCNFAAGGYPAAVLTHESGTARMEGGGLSGGTQGSVKTSNVSSEPDLSVPEGCPTSAEEAASGGAETASTDTESEDSPGYGEGSYGGGTYGDGENERDHQYTISNTGDEAVEYFLEARDGADFVSPDHDGWTGDGGNRAAGKLEPDETHVWWFDTLLTNVAVSDRQSVMVSVDGGKSVLDRYPRDDASDPSWMDEVEFEDEDEEDGSDEGDEDGEMTEVEKLEQRIEELEEENSILKEEVMEYERATIEMEEGLENAEENLPTYSSLFDALRDRLP